MKKEHEPADSEGELVRRLQAGELGAFDRLFERYEAALLAYVCGILQDRSLAEDVVQDCFVLLVRHIGRIRPDQGVGPWLFRVARNRAVDIARHRRFESVGNETGQGAALPEGQPDEAGTPLATIMQNETRERLMRALDTLSIKDRDVLMLRYFAGLSFKEMAEALRRPMGTVLWQVHKALRRLRQRVEEMGTL
ncbi:MAG: RNA polymerase sigma factor [Kiritimatiellae bacterium]|nr:RNA polymerase sigma factor [Kiritimatiellia bacterium]